MNAYFKHCSYLLSMLFILCILELLEYYNNILCDILVGLILCGRPMKHKTFCRPLFFVLHQPNFESGVISWIYFLDLSFREMNKKTEVWRGGSGAERLRRKLQARHSRCVVT